MIVKRIYQIADVHIPTYQRMDMFAVQLEKLIASIRDDINAHNLRPEEVRIVLCGDLVHSKNIVTNELNVFASTFIRNLSALAKVVCITGNHDIIESNSARIDTLTGIFKTAQFSNAILLDMQLDYESGIVYDDDITWALYSYHDDFNIPDIESARDEKPNNKIIGLFHGMLIGCKLYNGYITDSGNDKNMFDGCDAVMAGDIHKRQELKIGEIPIVYAGSPLQLDFGESITQHGYVVWNTEDLSHEFIDVPNEFGYYDFGITSIEDLKEDKERLLNY